MEEIKKRLFNPNTGILNIFVLNLKNKATLDSIDLFKISKKLIIKCSDSLNSKNRRNAINLELI